MAFEATALAISKATFLNADTGGKMLSSGRSVPREISAQVLAAVVNTPSLIRVAPEALAPRPIPGKMSELFTWSVLNGLPFRSVGGNGLPLPRWHGPLSRPEHWREPLRCKKSDLTVGK